ncbi:TetR/AcrR family transcriptional regulator [Leucobacter sp. UCMA 4100]|uniref:TetR/AcrR family transcriptional regulator n=1 Tax=Leucobacter sp. UCMA 4100 TaxID=2810534 RepID=UPI0022EAED15|nr:TetR/AcrR family transcriptional regulator [Leucobacter sp. UCMA 4100]MDA3147608.1 TetR/AcrR family transcriptional regulator [Leucobacter sp. UCMA 4100]
MVAPPKSPGRPRSEDARLAILQAVDGMLVEEGYAAMTMKGIAERAGVGRQTVYRWWSSKAEILLEACTHDAIDELTVPAAESAEAEVAAFLGALAAFLTGSDAGLAYRALLGEAQHDEAVAKLLREADILGGAAARTIRRVQSHGALAGEGDLRGLVAELIGPLAFRVLAGDAAGIEGELEGMAERFLAR